MRQELQETRLSATGQTEKVRDVILLVGHDSHVAQLLRAGDHRVLAVDNGSAAKRKLTALRPNLVITELLLPDMDGLMLCADIRNAGTAVVICSATRRRRDATLAYRFGADDFIAKPFDEYEFAARVGAALHRASGQPPTIMRQRNKRQLGDLVANRTRPNVRIGDQEASLTPTEYRLASALASRSGEVVSREELAQLVWGQTDAASGRRIDVHVGRLNRKLRQLAGASPPITTLRGRGYHLAALVESLPDAGFSAA